MKTRTKFIGEADLKECPLAELSLRAKAEAQPDTDILFLAGNVSHVTKHSSLGVDLHCGWRCSTSLPCSSLEHEKRTEMFLVSGEAI